MGLPTCTTVNREEWWSYCGLAIGNVKKLVGLLKLLQSKKGLTNYKPAKEYIFAHTFSDVEKLCVAKLLWIME